MTPNIRGVLSTLLPGPDAEEIDIIANDVKFTDPEGKGNTWEIVFRHPTSGFGHDKSQAILPYRDLAHKPTLFFCGDGVSDLSAAKHADLLFAKTMESGHSDLQTYCEKQGIRHVPFVDLYVHPFFFFSLSLYARAGPDNFFIESQQQGPRKGPGSRWRQVCGRGPQGGGPIDMFKALTKVVMSIKPKICLLMGKKNVKRGQDTMF